MGTIIVVFISVFLLSIGRFQGPPAFGGADAESVLRPQRMRCRRIASVSGAKPASTRRFEAKTEVNSASTHPGSLPMIKRNQNKTQNKLARLPDNKRHCDNKPWRQSRMATIKVATKPDGDNHHYNNTHGLGFASLK